MKKRILNERLEDILELVLVLYISNANKPEAELIEEVYDRLAELKEEVQEDRWDKAMKIAEDLGLKVKDTIDKIVVREGVEELLEAIREVLEQST